MMPLTVAALEAELLVELGPYLTVTGLDGSTSDGSNLALRGAIRRAVRHLGKTTADPIAVTDSDLESVSGWDVEKLIDVAKLRAFEVCWGNWPKVDFSAGGNSQSLSQLADRLKDWIEFLTERVEKPYGPDVSVIPGASARGKIAAGSCIPAGHEVPYCWPNWHRGRCR
jgi:hypothetical protein